MDSQTPPSTPRTDVDSATPPRVEVPTASAPTDLDGHMAFIQRHLAIIVHRLVALETRMRRVEDFLERERRGRGRRGG